MKRIFYSLLLVCGISAFVGCNSSDDAAVVDDYQGRVQKMVVKTYDEFGELQMTGTFDFNYDSGLSVTSVDKTVTDADGSVVEDQQYTYQYDASRKLVSYAIDANPALNVTYNGDKIKNLGFGEDLEFSSSGFLASDSYGTQFLYDAFGNPTGTTANASLWTYDNKKNAFWYNSPYFNLVFEEQFESYYSTNFFRSASNVAAEANGSQSLVHEMTYNSHDLPLTISTRYANDNIVLEKITFEYSE